MSDYNPRLVPPLNKEKIIKETKIVKRNYVIFLTLLLTAGMMFFLFLFSAFDLPAFLKMWITAMSTTVIGFLGGYHCNEVLRAADELIEEMQRDD